MGTVRQLITRHHFFGTKEAAGLYLRNNLSVQYTKGEDMFGRWRQTLSSCAKFILWVIVGWCLILPVPAWSCICGNPHETDSSNNSDNEGEDKKTRHKDGLRIATEHYYWKPGKALFHAVELEEYASAGVCFEPPVMDLGCGDGIFSEMLRERGILDSVDVALDYSVKDLRRVKKNGVYGVIQGDARTLPLKSGAIASVLANDSLCSVITEVSSAISEVCRVLSNQGLFVLTVPVSGSNEALLVAKALRRIGAYRLATRYVENLNRRLAEYQRFDEEGWLKKLQEGHFHIEQARYYFTPRQAFWANLFTPKICRVFGLLKLMRVGWLRRHAARIEEKMFRSVFVEEQSLVHKPNGTCCLLIVARKMS